MLTPTELRAAVERRLDEAGRAWLDRALTEAANTGPQADDSGGGPGPARWELDFASAGRHVRTARPATAQPATTRPATAPTATTGQSAATGHAATVPPDASAAPPAATAPPDALAGAATPAEDLAPHDLPDAARILILHAADADAPTAARLYAQGTAAERRAVLLALPHLALFTGPDAVPLVEDALRTNDTRLVAAAVGPYAARHLSPHSWRQAVLKCLFTGVPLTAVAAWERRARGDAELARMLTDYARERTAAGRPVPADLDRVLALASRTAATSPTATTAPTRALTREES